LNCFKIAATRFIIQNWQRTHGLTADALAFPSSKFRPQFRVLAGSCLLVKQEPPFRNTQLVLKLKFRLCPQPWVTVLAKANSELLLWPRYRKRKERQYKHIDGKYSFVLLIDRLYLLLESKMFSFQTNRNWKHCALLLPQYGYIFDSIQYLKFVISWHVPIY
jgi:hypothetical protein